MGQWDGVSLLLLDGLLFAARLYDGQWRLNNDPLRRKVAIKKITARYHEAKTKQREQHFSYVTVFAVFGWHDLHPVYQTASMIYW